MSGFDLGSDVRNRPVADILDGVEDEARLLVDGEALFSSGFERATMEGNLMNEEAMKIDAKRILLWSFVAGIGFSLGELLISTPVYILKTWMQVTHFGG